MHFSKISTVFSAMLAASAVAAPAPAPQPQGAMKLSDMLEGIENREGVADVAKRQLVEALDFAGKIVDRVLDHLEKSAKDDPAVYIGKHIQGKSTHFGYPRGEKKVGPGWLEAQTQAVCEYMTDASVDDVLVSSRYPSALRGLDWPARQDASEGQHEGDWVEISLAWKRDPNFSGQEVEMTASLCKDIIAWGVWKTADDGNPRRSQGFSAAHNDEWIFELDVTNIDDSDTQSTYGHINGPVAPYGIDQKKWEEFLEKRSG